MSSPSSPEEQERLFAKPQFNWARLEATAKVYLIPFFLLFAIFATFHIGQLSVFTVGVDDDVFALQPIEWLKIGRWGSFLQSLLVPQSVVPFLPIACFGGCIAAGYQILLRALGIGQPAFVHYLLFPLFAAFPTWLFLTEFDVLGPLVGFAVVASAGFLLSLRRAFQATDARSRAAWTSGAVFLGAFAIGSYQAFALLLATFVLAGFVFDLLKPDAPLGAVARRLLWAAAVLAASAVLCLAIAFLLLSATGGEFGLIDHFIQPERVLASPFRVIALVAEEAWRVYTGAASTYGTPAWTLALPVLIGILGIATAASRTRNWWRRSLLVLGGVGLLVTPFAMELFLYGGLMPLRTYVAVPATVWFLGLVGFSHMPLAPTRVGLVLLPLAYFQLFYVHSYLGAPRWLGHIHDAALASALHDRVGALTTGSPDQRIDFFGRKTFDTNYRRPERSTIGLSVFGMDYLTATRITSYMEIVGFKLPPLTSKEEHARLADEYLSMPAWPAQGSVRAVGDAILVKLSDEPNVEDRRLWLALSDREIGSGDPPAFYKFSAAVDGSWSVGNGTDVKRGADGVSFRALPRPELAFTAGPGTALSRCAHVEVLALLRFERPGQARLLATPLGTSTPVETPWRRVLPPATANDAGFAKVDFQARDGDGFGQDLRIEMRPQQQTITVKEIEVRCLFPVK